jgi:hypothetical protein
MNTQEAFTTIVTHLAKQAKKALSVGDGSASYCMYRSPEGLKCALGCLIPDDLYEPAMDSGMGMQASLLLDRYPALKKVLSDVDVQMLGDMQFLHDSCIVSEWGTDARVMADRHHLIMPELDWSACEVPKLDTSVEVTP